MPAQVRGFPQRPWPRLPGCRAMSGTRPLYIYIYIILYYIILYYIILYIYVIYIYMHTHSFVCFCLQSLVKKDFRLSGLAFLVHANFQLVLTWDFRVLN